MVLDGALCINCNLFGGEASHNASKLTFLFKLPFNQWGTVLKHFKDHQLKSPIHQTSTLRATEFKAGMEGTAQPINIMCDSMISKTVDLNRCKLLTIAARVILCTRQNISLRSHRDDSQYDNNIKHNPGNFQAILQYLSKYGNNALFQEHLATAPKSATYQ